MITELIDRRYKDCFNLGLCRKKSAGISHRPPLFSGVFFEDQQDVDQYVAEYDSADQIMDKVSYMYTKYLYVSYTQCTFVVRHNVFLCVSLLRVVMSFLLEIH